MGDLIDFMAHKKRKKDFPRYESELNRLWVVIVVWTPYALAREKQVNSHWMEDFFYPDKDW